MKIKSKKIISLALCIMMILSAVIMPSSAADAETCDHDYVEQVLIKPTCVSTGSKGPKCTKCGDIKVAELVDIPRLEHDWKETSRIEATYESTGVSYLKCSSCGKEDTVVIPAKTCDVHCTAEWEAQQEWTCFVEPTCTEVGKEQAWCDVCQRYAVRDIPANGHDERELAAVAATCTEYGKTAGECCYICHVTTEPQQWVEPLGHMYYTIEDVQTATCEVKGIGHTYCSREGCDYCERIELPKLSHTDANTDGFCDVCSTRMCQCFCHKDGFLSLFVRFFNTLLNNLIHDGEKVFCCCECMEPY